MDLTRRDFLRVAGASTVAGVLFAGCAIPERELIKQSPRDLPEDLANGLEDWYATSCGVCTEGHGVIVRVLEGRAKKIEGNPDHPTNRGALLPLCLGGVQALYHPDRIRAPQRGGSNITWAEGMQDLEQRIRNADASKTVLITGSERGHLGYVIETFAEATGIQHMTLEDVEQTVLREAVREVFGQDSMPHFDIQNAHSVLSIGADFLESWVAPLQYNRAFGAFRHSEGRSRGTLIHASSRFSMTAANADMWLPVAPGQEGNLALSIAYVLIHDGLADAAVANRMTGGQGADALAAFAPERVADRIGATPGVITPEKIEEVAHTLAENAPALVLAGGAAAAQSNGLFNVTAALALNGLLGSVGKEGGVVFNPAPPLAELAGLGSPASFTDWKALKARLDANEIDLVLVHGANPAHTLSSLGFADSLAKAGAIVSFPTIPDETTALADLVLPDQNYLESWGTDVPNPAPGYAVLTIQQPVVPPLVDENRDVIYDNRAFGDVLIAAGQALDHSDQLPWDSMEALISERIRAIYDTNSGRGSIQGATFEAFWVGVLQRGGWWDTSATSNAGWTAKALPTTAVDGGNTETVESGTYHLVPFATVGLGAGSASHLPWAQATPDPLTSVVWQTWVEVNAREARRLGFRDGDLVEVASSEGTIEAAVYIHPGIPPNVVAIPLGRGHTESGRYAQGFGANVTSVLAGTEVEGTGAQAWGTTRVTLKGTGRRVRLPRMEGGITGLPLEGSEIIQLTTG